MVFDRKEVILPTGMELARATLSHSPKFLTMELRTLSEKVNKDKEGSKADKSFELELWTWDECLKFLRCRLVVVISVLNIAKYIYEYCFRKIDGSARSC